MKIQELDLSKIDKLKISNEDKSVLSVIAQYANDFPEDVLRAMSRDVLSGDALAVAERLVDLATKSSAQLKSSRSGVDEFALVLHQWAALQESKQS